MADLIYTTAEIQVLEHTADRLHAIEAEISFLASCLELVGHVPDATVLRSVADALERPATQTRTAAAIGLNQIADRVRDHLQDEGHQHG